MKCSHIISTLVLVTALMAVQSAGAGDIPRPDPKNAALFARWLLNRSSWGVLTTLDAATKSPFGNIHSVTDAGTGSLYFYQSKDFERTGMNAVNDSRASLTLTEYVLDFCDNLDPQNPKCGKLTLSGKEPEIAPKEFERSELRKSCTVRSTPDVQRYFVGNQTVEDYLYLQRKNRIVGSSG